jgi:hypothetical protein
MNQWEMSQTLGHIFQGVVFPLMALSIIIIIYSARVLIWDKGRNTKYEKILAILWLVLFGVGQIIWYYINELSLV